VVLFTALVLLIGCLLLGPADKDKKKLDAIARQIEDINTSWKA